MARRAITVKVRRNRSGVPRVTTALKRNAGALAYNYGQRVEGGARRRAHVITGHLKSSIVRVRIDKYHHRVVVGAYYGIYEEYGTRYRPPHPYFRPAVAAAKAQYHREKRRLFK